VLLEALIKKIKEIRNLHNNLYWFEYN